MKSKKSEYILYIYYNGAKHPTTIERDSVEALDKWLRGKRNMPYLKGCNNWVIKNNEGYEIKSGKTQVETIIKIVEND